MQQLPNGLDQFQICLANVCVVVAILELRQIVVWPIQIDRIVGDHGEEGKSACTFHLDTESSERGREPYPGARSLAWV